MNQTNLEEPNKEARGLSSANLESVRFREYIKLRIDNLRKLAKEKRELENEEKSDIEKVAEEVFYNVEGDELPF